jgi:hypothetical protein
VRPCVLRFAFLREGHFPKPGDGVEELGVREADAGVRVGLGWHLDADWSRWKGALPNLMFPADRSWLISTLWDDDWSCVGGPVGLVNGLLHHPGLDRQ